MNNKEIAKKFQLLGKIMELHGENPFKTRSYSSAYLTLRKWPDKLIEMDAEQLANIPGVGRAIQDKILELRSTGTMVALEKYLDITPAGIVDMLQIKGFGPKKVLTVWKELGVESAGELLYAVRENRLLDLKGFGKKTQDSLKIQLEYHLESEGKLQFAQAEEIGLALKEAISAQLASERIEFTGALHRKEDIIDKIELITTADTKAIEDLVLSFEESSPTDGQLKYKG
ncbi:MAG: DNA polymerase/3'-5' exonuclease PolX, partial [Saprospiraceae bacterium]|nr:DNA polymerase/3'-5' exonuclease PolX [Saprospiraceae bacterium]